MLDITCDHWEERRIEREKTLGKPDRMLKWCAHHMAHGKEHFWPGGRHFQLIQLEDRETREVPFALLA